jgi:catechol 2,3-dioxygenase-like lactoylglutathione lyase family enzyme
VYTSPDQPTTLAFFTDVIGFEVSDQVPGIIAFTRCGEVHHNLAIQAAPIAYPHHVAFEVDDVDDVVRGGQAMVDADPDRHMWGVGRHAIGSNWFWYLREPGGTFIEYTSDIDRISAQDLYRPKEWQGHEFLYAFGPPTPAEFLEPADLADLIAESA